MFIFNNHVDFVVHEVFAVLSVFSNLLLVYLKQSKEFVILVQQRLSLEPAIVGKFLGAEINGEFSIGNFLFHQDMFTREHCAISVIFII